MPDLKKMTFEELHQEIEMHLNGITQILHYRRYKPSDTIGTRHIIRQIRDRVIRADRLLLEIDARVTHGVAMWGE